MSRETMQMLLEQSDINVKTGNCAMDELHYQMAKENYIKALKAAEFLFHNFPACQKLMHYASYYTFIAEINAHIALCEYFAGDERGAQTSIETALSLLPESQYVTIFFLTQQHIPDYFLKPEQYKILQANQTISTPVVRAINSFKAMENGKIQLAFDFVLEALGGVSDAKDTELKTVLLLALLQLCNKTAQLLVELPIQLQVNVSQLFSELFVEIPPKIAKGKKIFRPGDLAQLCFIILQQINKNATQLLQLTKNLEQFVFHAVPCIKQMRMQCLSEFLAPNYAVFDPNFVGKIAAPIDGFAVRLRKEGVVLKSEPALIQSSNLKRFVDNCHKNLQFRPIKPVSDIIYEFQNEFQQQSEQQKQISKLQKSSEFLNNGKHIQMIGVKHRDNQVVELEARKKQLQSFEKRSKLIVNPDLIQEQVRVENHKLQDQLLTHQQGAESGIAPDRFTQSNFKQREIVAKFAQPEIPARMIDQKELLKYQSLYKDKYHFEISRLKNKIIALDQLIDQYSRQLEKIPPELRANHSAQKKINKLNKEKDINQQEIDKITIAFNDPLLDAYRQQLQQSKLLLTDGQDFKYVHGVKDLYDNRFLYNLDFNINDEDVARFQRGEQTPQNQQMTQEVPLSDPIITAKPMMQIAQEPTKVRLLKFDHIQAAPDEETDDEAREQAQNALKKYVRPQTKLEQELAKIQMSNGNYYNKARDDLLYAEQVAKMAQLRGRRIQYQKEEKFSDMHFFRTRATGFIFSAK